MLKNLRIQNFKLWKDTGDLKLAPITIFFGPNSSGKSSILQFLLMLKQTAQSSDMNTVLDFGNGKSPVHLRNYREIINNHDTDLSLNFDLKWDFYKHIKIFGQPNFIEDVDFHCKIELQKKKLSRLLVSNMAYEFTTHDSKNGVFKLQVKDKKLKNPSYEMFWTYPDTDNECREKINTEHHPPGKFYIFPDQNLSIDLSLLPIRNSLENLLKELVYIGPLRDYPRPEYLWTGNIPETVGNKGEHAVEAMLAGMMGTGRFGFSSDEKVFKKKIEFRLKEMGLADIFELKKMDDIGDRFSVKINTPDGKCNVDLTQVGFGFSQILPVIVQSYYAKPGSTIILEQPEIHMHPKIQSDLADLFIDAIYTDSAKTDSGINYSCQFIIESHSEYLLRRLQRRIAEEKIKPEDVKIYFCTNTKEGAKIEELKTDEYGNINNWPHNFFGDRKGDIMTRAKEEIKRQINGEKDENKADN